MFLAAASAFLNDQQQAWSDACKPIQPDASSLEQRSTESCDATQHSDDAIVTDTIQQSAVNGYGAFVAKADAARKAGSMQLHQHAAVRLSALKAEHRLHSSLLEGLMVPNGSMSAVAQPLHGQPLANTQMIAATLVADSGSRVTQKGVGTAQPVSSQQPAALQPSAADIRGAPTLIQARRADVNAEWMAKGGVSGGAAREGGSLIGAVHKEAKKRQPASFATAMAVLWEPFHANKDADEGHADRRFSKKQLAPKAGKASGRYKSSEAKMACLATLIHCTAVSLPLILTA